MSAAPLPDTHPDYPVLQPLVDMLLNAGGGCQGFGEIIGSILRRAIDEVIDTPRTNRFTLSETEKTEKTYLGTKIEILVRSMLSLPKGQILDLSLGGVETDIKNTINSSWAIPREAVGHPLLVIKENEKKARCSVGMIVADPAYFRPSNNQDKKKGFSAANLVNAWWILKDHPYPPNFWEITSPQDRQAIMAAGGGSLRVAALFENFQKRPIARTIVQAVGQQDDPLRRIRRGGGARDFLAPKGIAILWGQKDRELIKSLGLGSVAADEFISYTPIAPVEVELLRHAKHID